MAAGGASVPESQEKPLGVCDPVLSRLSLGSYEATQERGQNETAETGGPRGTE